MRQLGLVFDTANVLDGEVLVITTGDDEGQEYLGRTGNRYQALDGGIEPSAIGFEVFDRDGLLIPSFEWRSHSSFIVGFDSFCRGTTMTERIAKLKSQVRILPKEKHS